MRPPIASLVAGLVLAIAQVSVLAQGSDDLIQIERDIERVLDAAEMDPAMRLELARRARAATRRERPDDQLLGARACHAEAFALYLGGQPVLETLNPCIYSGLKQADLGVYAQMEALRAWMLLVNGQSKESVATFEALLEEDLSRLDPALALRLNMSYATSLYQDGRALASIERFQLGLIEALDMKLDPVAVSGGNNLVVILVERGMYQAAQAWHERLQPALENAPRSHYTDSLELHGLQLLGELQDPKAAAEQLQNFISERPDAVPNIVGNAYEYMASFLCRTGNYDDALVAARKAIDTLAAQPIELADARLTLADVLISRGDYDAGLAELRQVQSTSGRAAANVERGHALMVRARLGQLGPAGMDIFNTFEEFDELRGQRERDRIEQTTRYFDSVRELQIQREELQRYELDRIRLESAAATSSVVASEQRALAQAERETRRLSIVILLLASGAAALLLMYLNRRRTDRELQCQAEKMNADLTRQVEEKSVALRQQLGDQAALERSLAETRHNEVVGRITGNVAHDFNNLLQIVSLSTERLSAKNTSEEDRSLFDGTRAALQHARSIIKQLLAYARRQKLRPAATRFGEYLADTEALFRVAVDDRIEFSVMDESGDASIVIDSSQLTTILLNLLSNACDAMPSGGELKLTARHEAIAGGAPPWTNLASGDYLVVEVTDTGIGMNERTMRRAFEPFYTDRASGKGTGLGLSSVYGFVKQSRGDVKIDSEPGVGTSIRMAFPATHDLQPDASSASTEATEINGMRCLIVEDSNALGRALTVMFEARGAIVALARSAEEARGVLGNAAAFDLVISDVRMKGEHDGYELRDWMGSHYPQLPVLLMTGFVDDERRGSGVPIIHKPFTEVELLAAIRNVLERYGALHSEADKN